MTHHRDARKLLIRLVKRVIRSTREHPLVHLGPRKKLESVQAIGAALSVRMKDVERPGGVLSDQSAEPTSC